MVVHFSLNQAAYSPLGRIPDELVVGEGEDEGGVRDAPALVGEGEDRPRSSLETRVNTS